MTFLLLTISFFFVFYFFYKLSFKLNLIDYPGGRKIHKLPTPYIGGISILVCHLITVRVFEMSYEITNIVIYSALMVLLGLFDDSQKLRIDTRIIFQIIVIFLIIYNANVEIVSLGTYELIGEINLNSASKIFTVICLLVFINAFNYNDGINGSAALVSLIIFYNLLFFDYIKLGILDRELIYLSFPILIFFILNLNFLKKLIFLGNNGSLYLSTLIGFTIIFKSFDKSVIDPSLIIWLLAYIIYEFLAVTHTRFKKNQNIFKSGNDHLHYFLQFKFGNLKTLIFLFILNNFFIIFGYAISLISPLLSIIAFSSGYFFYYFIRLTVFEKF